MAKEEAFIHWRDSARIPKFFTVDARAAVLVFVFFLRPNWYTLGIAVGFFAFLSLLDYFKIPLFVALRIFRGFIGGKRKQRIPRA